MNSWISWEKKSFVLLISPSTRFLEYPIAPAAYDFYLYLRSNFDGKMLFNFFLFFASLYSALSP